MTATMNRTTELQSGVEQAIEVARDWVNRAWSPGAQESRDPLLELWQVCQLADYSAAAGYQWRRRSDPGFVGEDRMRGEPFPAPDRAAVLGPKGGIRVPPAWRLTTVVPWLVTSGKWDRFVKRAGYEAAGALAALSQ